MRKTLAIFLLALLLGCSDYQKLLKSSDFEAKYNKAVELYENEDYFKAQQLLEELLTIYKGSARGEEVYFYYSYCYYGQKNFLMAGYHFRNFTKTYPTSKHTEECEFLTAYCFYLESPEPSLDQTNTLRAIEAMQVFINKYPESEKIEQCNELIDKLRDKLEIKSFNAAKMYYTMGDYKSAIVALKNSLKDYPDTQFREELLFLIVKSNFLLAENSVEAKKKQRYQDTINEYYTLLDEYPESGYIRDAEKLYGQAKKYLSN